MIREFIEFPVEMPVELYDQLTLLCVEEGECISVVISALVYAVLSGDLRLTQEASLEIQALNPEVN